MKLKLLCLKSDSKDRKCFEKINSDAFPQNERMDMEDIFAFAESTNTDVLGIYDENAPVGFAVILKNSECGYIYFLAVDKNMRSRGYGSAALEKIISMYPKLQIVLDFEEIDEKADNIMQRIRRKNFYLQNGFHETGNYTFLCEERFEVVCTKGELKKAAFKDLIKILHTYNPVFLDVLL